MYVKLDNCVCPKDTVEFSMTYEKMKRPITEIICADTCADDESHNSKTALCECKDGTKESVEHYVERVGVVTTCEPKCTTDLPIRKIKGKTCRAWTCADNDSTKYAD